MISCKDGKLEVWENCELGIGTMLVVVGPAAVVTDSHAWPVVIVVT